MCSRPRQNVKLGSFTLYVVQRRQRNVQKSMIRGQSCCLTNLMLKLPIIDFYYHRHHHHHTTIHYPCASRYHHYKDPKIGGLRRRRKSCLKSDIAMF